MQLSLRESECTFYQNCEVTHTFLGKRTACPQISAPALLPKIRRKLFRRQSAYPSLAETGKDVKIDHGFISGIGGLLDIYLLQKKLKKLIYRQIRLPDTRRFGL